MTGFARSITNHRLFRRAIIAVILLAGVLAGLETDAGIVAAHGPLLRTLDAVVLGVFIVEVVLKMAAHGRQPLNYFRDGWNIFDFMIVALCCLPVDSRFAVVLRLARVLRLMRLVSALPKLQLLVGALFKSLSSMGYVSILLGVILYIYAIVGVHLFGGHAPNHFGDLGLAFLTLFQMITLDDWRNILNLAQGAHPVGAVVYFISFIMLGTMIMLNLFIGIIMNSMAEMHVELAGRQVSAAPDAARDELMDLENQLASAASRLAEIRVRIGGNPDT